MPDEVQTFVRRKQIQRDRDELKHLIEAARSRRPQERLQLRKRHLDRIEVRAVRGQEAEPRPDAFDRGLHLGLFVHGQVIEDDDIARAQCRDQDLLDVGEKRGIVDRTIKHRRRGQAIDAQPRNDRLRLPVSARRVVAQPYATRTPTVAAQQIGGDAGFIDEDVGARVVEWLRVLPVPAGGGDVRPTLLVGVYRFF